VILLKNPNDWNIFPPKRRIIKKEKGARIEKKKRWNHIRRAPCTKKREDEIYRLLGEILSKERKKGDHIFL
jgi:hypothetical protein